MEYFRKFKTSIKTGFLHFPTIEAAIAYKSSSLELEIYEAKLVCIGKIQTVMVPMQILQTPENCNGQEISRNKKRFDLNEDEDE